MKIRIKGNSLRLRLMQQEIKQLKETTLIEESIVFAPNSALKYRLQSNKETTIASVDYIQGTITVTIPTSDAIQWTDTDQVGISFTQRIDDHNDLDVLIEKDFKCLTDRPSEDEGDAFPNPHERHC